MKLVNVYALRKEIAEYGAQLAGCYSAGIARYMNKMLDYIIAEVDRAPSVNAVIVTRFRCWQMGWLRRYEDEEVFIKTWSR